MENMGTFPNSFYEASNTLITLYHNQTKILKENKPNFHK